MKNSEVQLVYGHVLFEYIMMFNKLTLFNLKILLSIYVSIKYLSTVFGSVVEYGVNSTKELFIHF